VKPLENIVKFGALSYVIICVFQAVLFPPNFLSSLDNYLFVFALINLMLISYRTKEWRMITLAFILFFLWSIFVEFSKNGMAAKSNLPYLLHFLKWPAILVTILSLKKELFFEKSSQFFIDGLFFVIVSINLMLLINPFGYGELMQNLFSPKPYSNFVFYNEFQNFRLVGTQMNPNDNAVILSLFYLYYLIIDSKKWYFTVILVAFILLTQSRTLFILLIILTFLYLFIKLKKTITRKRFFQVGLVGMVLLTSVVLSSNNLRSIFTGGAFHSHSLQVRMDNFGNAINVNNSSLFFGNGVINNPVERFGVHVDSEFIMVIIQFGLVGLLLWGVILFAILKQFKLNSVGFLYWCVITLLVLGVSFTNFTFTHGNLGVAIVFALGMASYHSKDRELNQ